MLSSSKLLTGRKSRNGDVRKCRKVYGIENRSLWCTQCKWKKACTRFFSVDFCWENWIFIYGWLYRVTLCCTGMDFVFLGLCVIPVNLILIIYLLLIANLIRWQNAWNFLWIVCHVPVFECVFYNFLMMGRLSKCLALFTCLCFAQTSSHDSSSSSLCGFSGDGHDRSCERSPGLRILCSKVGGCQTIVLSGARSDSTVPSQVWCDWPVGSSRVPVP